LVGWDGLSMLSISRGRQFLQHVLPAVIRPLRILWNQIIGFVFLVLAVWFGIATVHGIRNYEGGGESVLRVLGGAFLLLLTGGFAVESFWRARKASK
jgi:hypothetical protein